MPGTSRVKLENMEVFCVTKEPFCRHCMRRPSSVPVVMLTAEQCRKRSCPNMMAWSPGSVVNTETGWTNIVPENPYSLKSRNMTIYRKTGNFRVVQFSRNFTVSINPQKIKIRGIFSYFWKIGVEELVAYMFMVAVYGNYLFACCKTNIMQLSQNNQSLQAIWLEVNWSMTDPIYSVSHRLIFFCCCIWYTCNCFSFFIE